MTKNNGLSNAVIFVRFVLHSIADDFDANYKWMTERSEERANENTQCHNRRPPQYSNVCKNAQKEKSYIVRNKVTGYVFCAISRDACAYIHNAYTICALQKSIRFGDKYAIAPRTPRASSAHALHIRDQTANVRMLYYPLMSANSTINIHGTVCVCLYGISIVSQPISLLVNERTNKQNSIWHSVLVPPSAAEQNFSLHPKY